MFVLNYDMLVLKYYCLFENYRLGGFFQLNLIDYFYCNFIVLILHYLKK